MIRDSFVILSLMCSTAVAGQRAPALAHAPKPAPIKIAVIDSGLDLNDDRFRPFLCASGHRDFTGTTINDVHGHGTHVAGLIIKNALPARNFCLVIYKYYLDEATGQQNMSRLLAAMSVAATTRVDYVNLSGGGPEFNQEEISTIQSARGTTWVVAAGNDNQNVCPFPEDVKEYKRCRQENMIRRLRKVEQIQCPSEPYAYYPACYKDSSIVVVGSNDANGHKAVSSNTGPRVDAWEVGDNQLSTLPKSFGQLTGYMSGTSQAAAVHTGKMIQKDPRAQ